MPNKKDRKIYSEEELVSKIKNDDYFIKKTIKLTVLWVFTTILVLLTIAIIIEYVRNPDVKEAINGVVVQNFTAIILAGLYILGFNFLDRKKN